jgi:hypothetical protein
MDVDVEIVRELGDEHVEIVGDERECSEQAAVCERLS